jgi:hypothetical protein
MRSFATFTKPLSTFQDMFVLPDATNAWFSSGIGQVNLNTKIIGWQTFYNMYSNRSWNKIRYRAGVVPAMNGARLKNNLIYHNISLYFIPAWWQGDWTHWTQNIQWEYLKALYLQQILSCLEKIPLCHLVDVVWQLFALVSKSTAG